MDIKNKKMKGERKIPRYNDESSSSNVDQSTSNFTLQALYKVGNVYTAPPVNYIFIAKITKYIGIYLSPNAPPENRYKVTWNEQRDQKQRVIIKIS